MQLANRQNVMLAYKSFLSVLTAGSWAQQLKIRVLRSTIEGKELGTRAETGEDFMFSV